MSKEKQIEEMIEALKKCSCVYTDCEQECSQCSNEELYDDALNHIARTLHEEGYRKQSEGEWTKHIDEWDCEFAKCSCCGEEFYDASGEDTIDMFYNFCPNCGARMKGGE